VPEIRNSHEIRTDGHAMPNGKIHAMVMSIVNSMTKDSGASTGTSPFPQELWQEQRENEHEANQVFSSIQRVLAAAPAAAEAETVAFRFEVGLAKPPPGGDQNRTRDRAGRRGVSGGYAARCLRPDYHQ